MQTESSLSITGHRKMPVANSFIRQPENSEHLAIVFPGFAYTVEMPLLYYSTRLMASYGWDILLLEYAYNQEDEFRSLSSAERNRWFIEDIEAAWKTAYRQRSYQYYFFIGKSLGTLAMGHLLAADSRLSQIQCVWLTPLMRNAGLRKQITQSKPPSFFAAGTADRHYDPLAMAELVAATNGQTAIIDGADHGLEIPGKVSDSIHALDRVISGIDRFLGETWLQNQQE
jgi:hypothetical protein